MSFQKVKQQVASAFGAQKTLWVTFRTTFCKPCQRRNSESGLMEEGSRVIRAGETIEIAADDAEMLDLIERKYCYIVERTFDEKGRPVFTGTEPTGKPICGKPISCVLDPDAMESQQMTLLKTIADTLGKVNIGIVPKGAAT